MPDKILNITNGDYFNEYLMSESDRVAVPFCESIMDGDVLDVIFSDEFITLRSKVLSISKAEYLSKMNVIDYLNQNTYTTIILWFGKDTFCQMNLLTLLAYLEQIEFGGKIVLNYIDDETFETIEPDIEVTPGMYEKIYKEVLISKQIPKDVGILDIDAIKLYFDYISDCGRLKNLIRQNQGKNKEELICLLIEESKDYGLSDLQAEKLIGSCL